MHTSFVARESKGVRTMDEATLGNHLVLQKDTIIRMIHAKAYDDADKVLTFVSSLWSAAGYGYKIGELRQRLDAAREADAIRTREDQEWHDTAE
jgi:hypothetical protein